MKEIKTCEEILLKLSGLYYSMLPAKAVIKIGKKIAEEKENRKSQIQKELKAQIRRSDLK